MRESIHMHMFSFLQRWMKSVLVWNAGGLGFRRWGSKDARRVLPEVSLATLRFGVQGFGGFMIFEYAVMRLVSGTTIS